MKTRSAVLQVLRADRHDEANQTFFLQNIFSCKHQKAAVSWGGGGGLSFSQLAQAKPQLLCKQKS
jgi:hypothetical protein